MPDNAQHICVCICTYKRAELLRHLLQELASQETGGLFTYSIVVADNDYRRSAEPVVQEFAASEQVAVRYCVEPHQNIALARNKVVENARGDFVAFIDDDEFPGKDWLLTLYKTCGEYGADGVLGPVLRYFEEAPPKWIERSQLYKRPIKPTGSKVRWPESRTSNVLLQKKILADGDQPFRPEFRSGEDQDFFRRKIEKGGVFIWSAQAEAAVYEVVPPVRWKRSYLLRTALLRGASARLQPSCNSWSIARSLFAVLVYAVALPVALVLGEHRFMTLLVKLCDHLGKLLAVVGINPVKDPYVTE